MKRKRKEWWLQIFLLKHHLAADARQRGRHDNHVFRGFRSPPSAQEILTFLPFLLRMIDNDFGSVNFSLSNSHSSPFRIFQPDTLSAEDKQTADSIVESIDRFFAEKVDSSLIDKTSTIPPDVMNGLKELGLFGLQIPSEHGGLALTNTAYARVIERICLDGSIAVTLLAHQV